MDSNQVYYRTIWISDVHLGSKFCRATELLDFFSKTKSDYLILVGDIVDFWALKRAPYWPTEHNTVVQKILRKARHGTKVIFIPGNHDEILRSFIEFSFGDIELHEEYTHQLKDGKLIHCLHGDIFDIITLYHRWIARIGDVSYTFLLWLNKHLNSIRRICGLGFWSLSSYVKFKVKSAVNFISKFEECVIQHAHNNKTQTILCGHIHHAEIRQYNDILYINTGDWVENCTAIVETSDGNIQIIRWKYERNNSNNY